MRIGWSAALFAGGAIAMSGCGGHVGHYEYHGYLDSARRPNAIAALGPPPAQGSKTLAEDVADYRTTRALVGSPRWTLAVRDAEYGPEPMLRAYSCALGVSLTKQDAPKLYHLLDRVAGDDGAAERQAKLAYHRKRPFVELGGTICVPEEGWLKTSYSYPSGHSLFSWTAGLVLRQIAPDRGGVVMARARSYGDSRVICGVHYESDVQAGHVGGAAVFAALQANTAFKADENAARAELAALRANPPAGPDPAECAAEADAVAHPVE